MRLIDADKMKIGISEKTKTDSEASRFIDIIDEQPTAFDLKSVIKELEQQKNQYFRRSKEIESKFGENYESKRNYSKSCSYSHALEIVKFNVNTKNGGMRYRE